MTRSDHRAWLQFSRPRTWLTAFLLAVAGLWFASVRSLAQDAQVDYLTFTGDGQYVVVPHGPELNSFPFTIAFWLKTTQTDDFVGVATKYLTGSGNGWDIHLSNGYIRSYYFKSWSDRLWTGDGALDRPNGGFVADGRWHHIAYTVDGSGRFYVDGEVTDHLSWMGFPGAPTHTMELILGGTRVDKTTAIDGHFVGSLDDLRIWNRALDVDAVRQAMIGAAIPGDLVLHFDFDQEAGPILTNRAESGSQFNGAIRGETPPTFHAIRSDERPFPDLVLDGNFESTGLTPWISSPSGWVSFAAAAQGSWSFQPAIAQTNGFLRQRLEIPKADQEWTLQFAYVVLGTAAPADEILISLGNQVLEPVRLPGGTQNPYLQGRAGWKYAERTVRLPKGPVELEITVPPGLSPFLFLDDFKLRMASKTNTTTVGFNQDSIYIRESTQRKVVMIVRKGDLSKATYATLELRPGTAEIVGPTTDLRFSGSLDGPNRRPIRFEPGESFYIVELDGISDGKVEFPESATLALLEVENAAISRSELGIQVLDQPALVQLQIPSAAREGSVATMTLRLESGDPVEVRLRTGSAGTATPGSDFTPLDQTLVLTTTAVTFPVTILQDTELEELESINIEVLPIEPAVELVLIQEPSQEPSTLSVQDDERIRLVQRLFVPQETQSTGAGWSPQLTFRDETTRDAPEVTRISLNDGSLLFLDSEGQPMEVLGNGTGRLIPGANGIPEQILRVFPDGSFMGLSSRAGDTNRIQRFLPSGSPDPSFHPMDVLADQIHVSRSGASWVRVLTDEGFWKFHDTNGRSSSQAIRLSTAYEFVGTDAEGRSYWAGASAADIPLGLLRRCLPDGQLDPNYHPFPEPEPSAVSYSFGPLGPSGKVTVGVVSSDSQTGVSTLKILEVPEDGQSVRLIANRSPERFSGIKVLPSGDLTLLRTFCTWTSIGRPPRRDWVCYDYLESLVTEESLPIWPAILSRTASEFSGPVWATGLRGRDELVMNPDAWPPSPSLQTLIPRWYRELRTSPVPEAGFPDTGLFLPESGLSVPVLRAGSTAAPATVRGRLFPRTRNGWNEAEALPFEATFPVGAAETTVNVSFLAREGAQPLREFLLRLESGTGIDISPFRACRLWILDDQQIPAPGELRLVTGVGRDEEGTVYLIGNSLPGGGPRSVTSITSKDWGAVGGIGAEVLQELLYQFPSPSPRTWVLPISTSDPSAFFRQ